METIEKAVSHKVDEFYYKTPSYTRKAYKAYYNRNKQDDAFVNKRRLAQAEYYQRNKEKILEKKRLQRASKKKAKDEATATLTEVELESS